MNIILNGKPAEIAAARLDDLLAELGFADAVVATALNEDFVPKDQRGDIKLQEGDRLEVVAPLRGG